MRLFIFTVALTLGISASADLQRFAIVKGTNVLFWTQYDTLKPPTLPVGSTNVAITEAEAAVIQPGWSYADGVLRNANGVAISNEVKAKIDREKLLNGTISDLDTALANWDALSAAQQKAVLKRLTQIVRIMLVDRRNEFLLETQ